MEAMSPMGETIMDTSSVMPSPQPSRLMMGMGEESMDTLTMSPQPVDVNTVQMDRDKAPAQFPGTFLSTEGAGTFQGLNTSFTGSLSNLVLPAIPNAAATTSFLLNATSPTTVAAPFLLNQSNLTTATAGAPQFLVNGSAGVHPNTAFLVNTNPGGGNMQTLFLNPNLTAQGAPLMVQTPVSNTAFLVNSNMLNTSPSTLFLTHPSLAGSNNALIMTTNQGPPAPAPTMAQLPAAQLPAPQLPPAEAPSNEAHMNTQDVNALRLQTLHIQQSPGVPGATAVVPGAAVVQQAEAAPQNIIVQQEVVQGAEGQELSAETSAELELAQGVVEQNSLSANIKENKDMLALRLKLRRPREELVSQGIMPPLKATTPAFHEQRQRLERAKVGDSLQRKMRLRPDKAQLVHQHILEDTNMEPLVSATHQRLKRARIEQDLDCKIKNRPGPLELIEGNILKAEHFVEQAVKDGKVKFLKTSEMDTDTLDPSPYNFEEDSPEGCSDDPMSPPQSYSQQSDNPPSSVGSVPSPPDFTSYLEHNHHQVPHVVPPCLTSSHQAQVKLPSMALSSSSSSSPSMALSTASSMITIKQEPGVTSPPPVFSMSNTVTSSSPSSHKSGSSSSSSSSKNSRKKPPKRNKVKEIKFHEYKPPNEQASKLAIPANSSNPYNLLLMQQQLLLQLQLLQQQHHQLILPNAPNMGTTSGKLSASNPGSQSPSSTTVTSSSSPTPQDSKAGASNMAKMRILSNLEDMKVSELKMELKNRGLHVSGTKPQLVERLRPYADVSMSPVSTASSSNHDVTSSSTCPVGSGTKVTSSTDASQDVASETNSARASMSSPPVSPPDFKSPVSVANSELSDPASPGSAFDPMSPSTFQMAPQASFTANPSSVLLQAASPPMLFTQTSEASQPKQPVNVQQLNAFQKQTFQMDLNESNPTTLEMMDVSAQLGLVDPQASKEIVRQQQQKIEELQRALRLSQLQLQHHQTHFLPSPTPPPPPPPPPPHPAAGSNPSSQTASPIKLATLNSSPPNTLPSHPPPPPTTTTIATHPPPPPMSIASPPPHMSLASPPPMAMASPPQPSKPQSPPKQSPPPVFQPQDFLQALTQQQQTFTFSSTPPSVQPFHFPKASGSDVKPVGLTNGLASGQKSTSLPSSPTESGGLLSPTGGLPSYNSPPPNYEEAVRQTKERKQAQLGSFLSPGNTETGEPRMTKSQDLDDLLEVLVDHGYQIPGNKDVSNLANMRIPPVSSVPSMSLASSCSPSTSPSSSSTSSLRLTQSVPSLSTMVGPHGVGGGLQLPLHPPPPHPSHQHQHQHSPHQQHQQHHRQQVQQRGGVATPIAIPQHPSAPSPAPMEISMDIDSADLTLSALDVAGKPCRDLAKEHRHMAGMSSTSSATTEDKDNANILSFDLPSMQVDSERESAFWTLGDNASPSAGMLCPQPGDADMNWLDVMMSTGSGLTPVSVTPPTSIGAEGTPLGKEPFSLNLFDDDTWDNIHVTD